MATEKVRIRHTHGGREVVGMLEYTDATTARKFAASLNRKFPNRNYRVEPVEPKTDRERFLELVK